MYIVYYSIHIFTILGRLETVSRKLILLGLYLDLAYRERASLTNREQKSLSGNRRSEYSLRSTEKTMAPWLTASYLYSGNPQTITSSLSVSVHVHYFKKEITQTFDQVISTNSNFLKCPVNQLIYLSLTWRLSYICFEQNIFCCNLKVVSILWLLGCHFLPKDGRLTSLGTF